MADDSHQHPADKLIDCDCIQSPPRLRIHVDLDGLWTLPQCYGYAEDFGGRSSFEHDPVFEHGLPRLIALFAELGVQSTIFVVGRDTGLEAKRAGLRAALADGHAAGNHSWSHRIDLEDLPEPELRAELERTQQALAALAGAPPAWFRAPGYAAGPRVLAAAARSGLRCDGSPLPTPWAPLLRFSAARLRARVMREVGLPPTPLPGAARQYGGAWRLLGGAATAQGTPWCAGRGELELRRYPAAVSPVLGLPLQMSLGMLLGAPRMARALTAAARRNAGGATWILHGLDFLAPEEFLPRLPQTLAGLRPLRHPLEQKLAAIRKVVSMARAASVPVGDHPAPPDGVF